MPKFELNAEMSIEKAVNKYIRSCCPLIGPVTIEQLTMDTPTENDVNKIIKSAYTPSESLPKRVPNRNMVQMADVFWKMLRYYVVPSHAEARAWCLYLMRICVCLEELHNIENVVMLSPAVMVDGMYYMVMPTQKVKGKEAATLASEYVIELFGTDTDPKRNYQKAIEYVMAGLSSDPTKYVDVRQWHKANVLPERLTAHIQDSYRKLYESHQAGKINAINVEQSKAYEEEFKKDGFSEESTQYLSRPSLAVYQRQYEMTSNQISVDVLAGWKDFVDFGDTESSRALNHEAVQLIMFYSDVPAERSHDLAKCVDAFIGMIISDGVTPATAFQEIKDIHKKYKYRNMQPQSSFLAMEGENFKLLESLSNMFMSYEKMGDKSYEADMRHLISRVPAIKEDGPAIKEGGPAITQHAADEPAAPGKTTPGETIALEKHKEKVGPSPADESDTNESNLQSMFLWGFTGIVCWWTFGRD